MEKQFSGLIKSEGLKDLTIDVIENAIDNEISDEIIKEIPLLKSIFVIKNIYTSYTDKIFLKKALHTLIEVKDVNWKERIDFINELKDRDISGSEKILMLIDRLDTIEKCKIFGKLCKLRALKKINKWDFLHLSDLIQKAFIPHLRLHTYFSNEYESRNSIERKKIDPNPLFLMGILVKKPYSHQEMRSINIQKFNNDEIIDFKYVYSKLGLLLAEHSYYLLNVGIKK